MESFAANLREMARTPLHESHVAELRRLGTLQHFAKGAFIVEVGTPMDQFFYVLEGGVEVVDPYTQERYFPHVLGPGQFMGEIAFLNGGVWFLPMRATEDTTVIAVPRDAMLNAMARIPEMSDIIITVYAGRRRNQIEHGNAPLTLIGYDRSRDIRRIADFASRNKIPFRILEDTSPEAKDTAQACSIPLGEPSVVFGARRVVDDPSPARVAQLLGFELKTGDCEILDVLIVGGGPAGVAAAVYAGAEGLSAVVVEDMAIGGQAGTSSRIENYMGFPTGISGADLVWRGEVQAMKFGTRFAMPRRVTSVKKRDDGVFIATLDNGRDLVARAIVVATGVQYRRLPLERLSEFESNGIYYAATEMEARACSKADVVVIGGGNSAGQAAMFLSRNARHVHILVRGDSLANSMSEYLSSRLVNNPNVTIHYRSQLSALHGEDRLGRVDIDRDGDIWTLETPAVFVMVGAAPNTDWLQTHCALDSRGFVITGEDQTSPFATSCPGIFAVGDVRAGSTKRVASAVGEGSVVISKVWEHVNSNASA